MFNSAEEIKEVILNPPFSGSLMGSLIVTTIGLLEGKMVELNPFMSLLFSKGFLWAWVVGVIIFSTPLFSTHYAVRKGKFSDRLLLISNPWFMNHLMTTKESN